MKNTLMLKRVEKLAKRGLSSANTAKELGMSYNQLYTFLESVNVKYKSFASEKTPQNKAWGTRRKNEAIEAYKNAKTGGIKASIARKFNIEFGVDIKEVINTTKKEVVTTTSKKALKEAFNLKEVELTIPFKVRVMFEELTKRIEELEGMVKK